jgi:hypothetical protein
MLTSKRSTLLNLSVKNFSVNMFVVDTSKKTGSSIPPVTN